MGIGGSVLPILTQFLSNRSQQVMADCCRSKLVNVVSGVPHCSVIIIVAQGVTIIIMTWCFRKTFQLTHKFGSAWAIKMTADREEWSELPMHAATSIYTKSGTLVIRQEIKCTTTCMGWADNQLIATRHRCEVKDYNTMTFRGCRTHPLLMIAIKITHKKERGTESS